MNCCCAEVVRWPPDRVMGMAMAAASSSSFWCLCNSAWIADATAAAATMDGGLDVNRDSARTKRKRYYL